MPVLKNKLNRAIKTLEILLDMEKNQEIQKYLSKLNATPETNYSLWKAIKRSDRRHNTIRRQSRGWGRSEKQKAETFAMHLSKIFKHNP